MKKLFALLIIIALNPGCDPGDNVAGDLAALLPDTGGSHLAMAAGSTAAPYGFYLYTPGGYTPYGPEYPLLVFLHGAGEVGDSSADAGILDKILVTGVPQLIAANKWHPSHPMLVVSPQCPEHSWNTAKIHELIQFMKGHYRVNPRRIYITGLSMGAIGTYAYIQDYGSAAYAAAVVPIAGRGDLYKGAGFHDIPVWAFHGDADSVINVDYSISMIHAINEANPATRALLTIYPGVGHDSWSRTYDGSGMGQESPEYDPFEIPVYDWMFLHTRN